MKNARVRWIGACLSLAVLVSACGPRDRGLTLDAWRGEDGTWLSFPGDRLMQEYPEYPLDVPGSQCLEVRLLNERGSSVQLLRYRVFRSDADLEDDDDQYWRAIVADAGGEGLEDPVVAEDGRAPFPLEFQIAEEAYDDTQFGVLLQVEFQEVGDSEPLISEHLLFVIEEDSASFSAAACGGNTDGDDPTEDGSTNPTDGPPDSGGDAWYDWWEGQCGTDPFDGDSVPTDDNDDGWCDELEQDSDGDGWYDWFETECDSDPFDSGSLPADQDSDGTCDVMDSDQESDSDGHSDWLENVCGSDRFDSSDEPLDSDGDGICDAMD